MTEIQIDLVELRKLDLSFPYFSKEEIMKCFDITDTAYDKYRKMFKEKVKDKHYPSICYLKMGTKEFFSVYAWLHFFSNFEYYQDKRLEKKIVRFTKKTVEEFKEIGVA